MSKLVVPIMAFALLGLAITPAWACRVGGDQVLFEDRPTHVALEGAEVIFVHFANEGHAFDNFGALYPRLEGARSLIGVARLEGGKEQVPVYARVTSCTHGFFGRPATSQNGDFYLVGKYTLLPDGSAAFQVGGLDSSAFRSEGNSDGAWHY